MDSGGIWESGRCWTFFVPGPQIGVWANKNGGGVEGVHCLYSRQVGIFWTQPYALWAMQCTSHISAADAKLSWWVKPHLLSHLLRWYSHIFVDSQRASPQLCVVFDQFKKYNLKLKPSKCSLFKEEINYLAHQVSKEGVQPNNLNLKAITEYALPQTYTEVCAFLGLMGHYW